MSAVEVDEPRFGQIDPAFFKNRALASALAPLLLRAVAHADSRYSFEAIMQGLEAGKFELWCVGGDAIQAVAITTVEDWPSGKRAYIVLRLAGPTMLDAAAFFRFLPKMEGMARQAKCDVMQMIGRKGWERDLNAEWRTVATVYERELTRG